MPSLVCQRRVCLSLASRSACFAVRLNVDSTQCSGCLVCIYAALVFIPLVVDLISIITLTLTLLKRILAVLLDKEVRTQIFPGVSCLELYSFQHSLCQSMHKVESSSDIQSTCAFATKIGRTTLTPKVLDRHMSGHTSDDVAGLPLAGGLTTLQSLANVPKTWPLARLTIPLSGFSKHSESLKDTAWKCTLLILTLMSSLDPSRPLRKTSYLCLPSSWLNA